MTERELHEVRVGKALSQKFSIGECIPFKGIVFRVALINGKGIAMVPVGYTGAERKKQAEEMRAARRGR